ncbi:MAG: hypothetical protein J6O50_06445 [Ruminiclostridium sp.]|nr:hypothetical protein [Ruminiclostridium sp.]
MKGFETMKKRKIVSFFTAIAIAVACIIVPPADKGLDVVASAVSVVSGGGITLTKVGAADTSATDTAYISSLKNGEKVQLNINIPQLNTDLNAIHLRVFYNINLFTVTKWYAKTDDTEHGIDKVSTDKQWPTPGNIVAGTDGDVYYKTSTNPNVGILTISCGGEPEKDSNGNEIREITAFKDSAVHLEAILEVTKNVTETTPFRFFIIDEDSLAYTADNDTYGDNWSYDGKGYTSIDYAPDGAQSSSDYVSVWNPTSKLITSGNVTFAVSGKLNNVDISQYGNKTVYVNLFGRPAGQTSTPWTHYDDDDTDLTTYTIPVGGDIPVKEDGSFEVRGLTPGKYKISVKAWGKINTGTDSAPVLADEKIINIESGKSIPDIDFWLFGDVDHSGAPGANDATLVLKFLVGRTSSIAYSNGTGNTLYTIANVFDNDDLNARDATQILRNAAELPNVFQTKSPYVNS